MAGIKSVRQLRKERGFAGGSSSSTSFRSGLGADVIYRTFVRFSDPWPRGTSPEHPATVRRHWIAVRHPILEAPAAPITLSERSAVPGRPLKAGVIMTMSPAEVERLPESTDRDGQVRIA
jgi:hypothetical protein